MRFHLRSIKLLLTLACISFIGLLSITGLIKPVAKQESLQEDLQQPLRLPLVLANEDQTFNESQTTIPANNSTKTEVSTKKPNSTTAAAILKTNSSKNESIPKTTLPEIVKKVQGTPSPVKDDPTDKTRKFAKYVNITFDDPFKYKGPYIDGWPPTKDRRMSRYILPDEDTFPLRPSLGHFQSCDLLVIVHSAVEDFSLRQGVRETWIKFVTENRVENVSVIFLIGNQNAYLNLTDKTRLKVIEEHARYDDILQANMVDHYNNLTLKSVFTLKFFLNESNFEDPPPFHLMKIDNDAYLNLPQLQNVLKDPKLRKSPMFLLGHRYGTKKKPPQPIRLSKAKSRQPRHRSKWWVPKYLYNGSRYPVILGGSGYVTTRPAAECLFNASMHLPFFHLEDVFLTGFAAESCKITRFHSDGFHPNAVHFADLKETDILWHYLGTKSVKHMHRIFMYEDLLREHEQLRQKLAESEKGDT